MIVLYTGLLFALTVISSATNVSQCPGGDIANLHDKVTMGKCVNPPCRLRRNTRVPVKIKFIAEDNYKNLTLIIYGNIAGVKVPYLGVDGTSPCDKIFEEDGTTKNNCHFEKGKTYVFKFTIDVLRVYPKIKATVHWSITDTVTRKHAICFEVPVSVTN